MNRISLDNYDIRPKEMVNYLRYYGWHFNKKMAEFATSLMIKEGKPIKALSKDAIDDLLKQYDITLKNNVLYDYVYVANMCKADFYKSSIEDEKHFVHYIKDVVDDEDAYDGIIFNRFYADMCKKGIPIDWAEML